MNFASGELDIPEILKAAKKVEIKHYFIEDESSNVKVRCHKASCTSKG